MQLNSLFNNYDKFRGSDYSNFDHSKILPRHRWYYFKEGFSPLLVEEAISLSGLNVDEEIIDPFSGSGTVPLVASMGGYPTKGFEVNPFMAFVANAKQINLDYRKLDSHEDKVLSAMEAGKNSNLEGFSTFTQTEILDKWLFNLDVLQAFEGGWQASEALPYKIKNIFKLALISSAMKNCNAVKDGKCLRYKKGWKEHPYSKESIISTFLEELNVIKEDLESSSVVSKGEILVGDVRKKISSNPLDKKFKLCITSPPYLNSFDYSDIYRPELFLGKFVKDNHDLSKLRLKTLRSHLQIGWKNPVNSDFGLMYQNCIGEIRDRKEDLWNKKIPTMIQAYFEDMEKILFELACRAEKNASLWLVVSTSAYAGVEVPVDFILADIGLKVGWNLEEVVVTRYMRNSTQNANRWNKGESRTRRLRESIVIFRGLSK